MPLFFAPLEWRKVRQRLDPLCDEKSRRRDDAHQQKGECMTKPVVAQCQKFAAAAWQLSSVNRKGASHVAVSIVTKQLIEVSRAV